MNIRRRAQMVNRHRDHVAIEIEAMLSKAKPLFTTECCIYRVPHEIRKFKQDEYTPKVVSIGPLHHGDSKLLPMEGHKQIYCLKFIERSRSEVSLDDLVSRVQELEPKVRRCYADNIKLSKEELVKVILVDCGFIIEIFLRHYSREGTGDDVILSTSWLGANIELDLLLLENQLPFFILEELYNLAFASSLNRGYPSFLTLALDYFNGYIGEYLPSTCIVAHFTDLLRTSHLQPPNRRPPRVDRGLGHLYSATELKEAGVKFRVNYRSQSFLALQFSGSYLKIPHIKVMDSTETWIRNMVALEQCHYPRETYIADYMQFINFLINTDKDVDLLVKNGIIVNLLGDSNEVAELFNGLGKNIFLINFNGDYLRIVNELNTYYKHPLHSKMATLKHHYCNTPWKTVASIAGIVLLILTIIQTVFSIIK